MILIENDATITDNKIIAEKLNSFFSETVEQLDIERFTSDSNENTQTDDIENIVKIYQSHPSIIKIKENIYIENKFYFHKIDTDVFEKLLLTLDSEKMNINNGIPVKPVAI